MPQGEYYVYILANDRRTVLYTGVTNNLERRMYEHRSREASGFTKRYNVHRLVYVETSPDATAAIQREKQIKAGSRAKKEALINQTNPTWSDLAADWFKP